MKWKKKGRIFVVDGKIEWMQKYASMPMADKVYGDVYRIYFNSRNSQNMASIGFVEIDIKNPSKILKISEKPVLSPGRLGSFDDTGVWNSSLVNHNNEKYLYYIGWNQSKTIPFRWSIGLAISKDNGDSFKRYSEGPIMDRNTIDPYLVSSPTVFLDDGIWKMYYISAIKWEMHQGEFRAPYNIRYAESKDGINWERKGIVCIDFNNKNETRIARASVFREEDTYKMLYCYAGKSYRIGYAESKDGINWERKDGIAGINVSPNGWDSEMIEYPFVFEHNDKKYLLYNGNNYGESGFGYAVLECR